MLAAQRRPSDISNGEPLGEIQRSVTPPSASRLSQSGRRSLLKSSFKGSNAANGGGIGSQVIASQLRTNTERQEQIERKAAQVNEMFA